MPPLQFSSVAAKEKQEVSIGDEVSVRDKPHSSWLLGVVTSLNPTEVQVKGWPMSMTFKFMKPETRKVNPVSPIQTVFKTMHPFRMKHVIGRNGRKIKKIRSACAADIRIIDSKTHSMSEAAEEALKNSYSRNYCQIQLTGTMSQINSAWNMISGVEKNLQKMTEAFCKAYHEIRIQRYAYQARYSKNLKGAQLEIEQWLLQKQQHGANGCWHTKKFKNKGRDRCNRKARKGKKEYKCGNRKHLRKSSRVSASRRFSL